MLREGVSEASWWLPSGYFQLVGPWSNRYKILIIYDKCDKNSSTGDWTLIHIYILLTKRLWYDEKMHHRRRQWRIWCFQCSQYQWYHRWYWLNSDDIEPNLLKLECERNRSRPTRSSPESLGGTPSTRWSCWWPWSMIDHLHGHQDTLDRIDDHQDNLDHYDHLDHIDRHHHHEAYLHPELWPALESTSGVMHINLSNV